MAIAPAAKKDVKKKSTAFVTPEFRASFPALFAPRAAVEGQALKYSVVMLFDKKTDITTLKQAVANALIEKYGPDKAKWPKGLRLPFRDGSEKEYDGYENTVFVTASSKNRPGLVDQALQPIIDPENFGGGDYARAEINAFCYSVSGNNGVSFGLNHVQKTRDGVRFSGRGKAEDAFDAIPVPSASASETADPLADIGA